MRSTRVARQVGSGTDDLKFMFGFQWKALTASVDAIAKGISIYFVLLLASIGAVYQSGLSGTELQVVVYALLLVTVLFGPMMIFFAWGVIRGLEDLEETMRRVNPAQFDAVELARFFQRGRLVTRVAVTCCILILFVIGATVATIQFR